MRPDQPIDPEFHHQARVWLQKYRRDPRNSLLSDFGVSTLVVAHALMKIRRLEAELAALKRRPAGARPLTVVES